MANQYIVSATLSGKRLSTRPMSLTNARVLLKSLRKQNAKNIKIAKAIRK